MLKATIKSLLGRKLRLTLTALSIVLGVGFVAGTFVLTDTMNKAFTDLFTQVSSGSDIIVRAEAAFTPSQLGPGGGGGWPGTTCLNGAFGGCGATPCAGPGGGGLPRGHPRARLVRAPRVQGA